MDGFLIFVVLFFVATGAAILFGVFRDKLQIIDRADRAVIEGSANVLNKARSARRGWNRFTKRVVEKANQSERGPTTGA